MPRVASAKGVGVLRAGRVVRPKLAEYRAVHATWPAAGSATLWFPAAGPPEAGGERRVATAAQSATVMAQGLPVLARQLPGGPTQIAVRTLSHGGSSAAGVHGVVFAAHAAGGGRVQLGMNYSGWWQAYGADSAAGLGLVQLPGCALTTPRKPACQTQTPVAAVNDWASKTVTAAVTLPASGADVVLAAAPAYTDGGGASGTYAATTLKPSGTWTEGGSSGSFDYSYPLTVPPSAGALEPSLSLNYDSGSVDGQTADTQPQASWLGDGWSMPTSFVEQSYVACQDDPEGTASPSATLDECYDGPVLTLSLNGSSTSVVCTPASFSYSTNSTCAASADNGEIITHHVKSGNGQGTQFTDYWTVTTRAGTTYYFGLNRLPGWASSDAATNSVDSVPVYSAHSGDPCYHLTAGTFAGSECPMAYRWNLDYVTDAYGNAMAYYYSQDTNAYSKDGVTTADATSYVRDSHLSQIDYGFTNGNAYSGTPPDEVLFATQDRCFSSSCDPISTYYANWPDVPYQANYCSASKTGCSVKYPTFWSTVALKSITTRQWTGSAWQDADTWNIGESLPQQSDLTANLWLSSITRIGDDTSAGTSGGTVPLPEVTFKPAQLANRADPGTYPYIYRNRIGQITTETGSVITVNYFQPDACNVNSLPGPSTNDTTCFPEYWGNFTPAAGADWFNKWAVQNVTQTDPGGGSPGLATYYSYSSPAWHYDDNELVQSKYRTYGQWRGFADVTTTTGTGGDAQTQSSTSYYQGMSDDNNTTTVNVKDSQKGEHEDVNQLAGDVLETSTYTYAGSTAPVDNSQIYSYWVSPAQLSRTRSGLPALTANYTGQVEEWTRQAITDSGATTWRETETDTSYYTSTSGSDAAFYGLPEYTFAHGDLNPPASDANQQRCTTIMYAPPNTTENLVGLTAETQIDAAACGGTSPAPSSAPSSTQVNALASPANLDYSTNVISDTRTYYDDPTLASTWPQPAAPAWPQPVPGNSEVSDVQVASGYNSSSASFTYQPQSADLYDGYGRVTSSYDALGGRASNGSTVTYTPTTTAYTMTAGSTTKTVQTNPLGQATTTTYDPVRGLPVTITDANKITNTLQYDGLGRLTAEWDYGRAASQTPTDAYSYSITPGAPVVVTTKKLDDAGGTVTSTTLYDSLLRPRQSQNPTPQGGVVVTDHFYDSRGFEWKTNVNWLDPTASPGSTVLTIPDSQVPQQTVTQFDGLGRPVIVTSYDDSAVRSVTYTEYTGDEVYSAASGPTIGDVVNGDGLPQIVTTDALGRTTELDSYTADPTISTGTNPGGFATVSVTNGTTQATTYTFDPQGWQTDITDVSTGEQWTKSYDFLGHVQTATDPNSGTSTMTYDADGHLLTSTDADGNLVSWTYDPLGRKLTETGTPKGGTAEPVASWVYDNSNNAVSGMSDPIGQVTTATSYDSSGNAYTFQELGFNAFGESVGQTVTIPSTTATGTLGTTYTLASSYTTTTGLPLRDYFPASPGTGSLPAETVTNGYCTAFDLPCTLSSNLAGYTQNVTYTAFFQPGQEEIGSATNNAFITNTYDPNTGALDNTTVANTAVSSTPYDNTSYTYDAAGNLTSEQDVRNGSATELQCFAYDTQDRLITAWTTNGSEPCSAGPSTGSNGTVGDGITGSAYWTSWLYNPLGDQTSQTQHSLTGGTDTVTGYSYNGNGANQPDTLTKAVTSGGSSSTSTYSYDADGNTTARNLPGDAQSLSWYPDGKLLSDTTLSGTTSYVYDPSGNLLLEEDPGSTTLYIFGEQLTVSLSTQAVAGERFLSLPGGGDVVRTGSGTAYWFEITDQQGTSLLALDDTAANPVWRQETPFGAARGSATGTWPDSNGYLGKPTDANTGLTILGARNYDPAIGRFISVDPALDQQTPQAFNGYSYAGDNPVTNSDPSGMFYILANGCVGTLQACERSFDNPSGTTPSSTPGGSSGVTGTSSGGSWNYGNCATCVPTAAKSILDRVLKTKVGEGLSPGLYKDMQQFIYYTGSQKFTLRDALNWLVSSANHPWEPKVWWTFCTGFAGGSAQQCNYDPFLGIKLLDGGISGRVVAQVAITAGGLIAGGICNAAFDPETAGGAALACGEGAGAIISLANLGVSGQWTGPHAALAVTTGLLSGIPGFITAAADTGKLASAIINIGANGGISMMADAGYNNGDLTLRGAGLDLILGGGTSALPADNVVEYLDSFK